MAGAWRAGRGLRARAAWPHLRSTWKTHRARTWKPTFKPLAARGGKEKTAMLLEVWVAPPRHPAMLRARARGEWALTLVRATAAVPSSPAMAAPAGPLRPWPSDTPMKSPCRHMRGGAGGGGSGANPVHAIGEDHQHHPKDVGGLIVWEVCADPGTAYPSQAGLRAGAATIPNDGSPARRSGGALPSPACPASMHGPPGVRRRLAAGRQAAAPARTAALRRAYGVIFQITPGLSSVAWATPFSSASP